MSTIGLHLLNAVGGGTILRDAPTYNNGQWTENYAPLINVPCRRPFAPNARELELATRMETSVTHITYVLPGVDVQREDRMTIEGQEYRVTAVLPPSLPHHIKIMLEVRQHGAVT